MLAVIYLTKSFLYLRQALQNLKARRPEESAEVHKLLTRSTKI